MYPDSNRQRMYPAEFNLTKKLDNTECSKVGDAQRSL